MLRMLGDQLGRGLGERTPGIMLEVPLDRQNVAQERVERLTSWDEALVQEPRVPVVKDATDVEDDGGRASVAQPWRALKRRFVLLMT